MPLNRVRVIVPFIGGGYGGKNHARIEPVVALLARKARRPVQWILTRDEVFLTGRRFGAVVKIKTGFKRDGRLWARKVEAWYDMGAYALSGPANTKNAAIIAGGPYNIPHRDFTTYAVYTNLPPAGPYRGVGASHVCWAYESDIDDIARRCNLDPLEVRLKNLLQENDRFITGEPMISVGVSECVKQVAQSINWQTGAEQSLRAMQWQRSNPCEAIRPRQRTRRRDQEYVDAKHLRRQRALNADGSAILLTSTADMGQGAQTALAQIVADELALPFERVTVTFPDSDITPYDKSTSSSRATFHMGKAAQFAWAKIREQLFQAGAKALEARVEDLELRESRLQVKGVPERISDLSAALQSDLRRSQRQPVRQSHAAHRGRRRCCDRSRQGIVVSGSIQPPAPKLKSTPRPAKSGYLQVASAVDVGKAVHPLQCVCRTKAPRSPGWDPHCSKRYATTTASRSIAAFLDYLLPSMLDHPGEFQSCSLKRLIPTAHAAPRAWAKRLCRRWRRQLVMPSPML